MLGIARPTHFVEGQCGPGYNLICPRCLSREIELGAKETRATGPTIVIRCNGCGESSYITLLIEKSKEKPRDKLKTVGLVLVSHVLPFKKADVVP